MVDGFRQGKPKGRDDASETLKEAHAKIGELTLEKDFFVVCWDAGQTGAAGPHQGGLAAGHLPAMPAAGRGPQVLLSARAANGGAGPGPHAPHQREAHGPSVLRQPPNEAGLGARLPRRGAAGRRGARNLQHGSQGSQFTSEAFTGAVLASGRGDVDGQARALAGQSVHRAAVAVAQVRGCASARVDGRRQGAPSHWRMDRLPQRRTATLRPAGWGAAPRVAYEGVSTAWRKAA